MSKYIVLYAYTYSKEVVHPPIKDWTTPPTKTEHYSSMGMRKFDDYQEAYNFAQTCEGNVLQTIQPKSIEPMLTEELL